MARLVVLVCLLSACTPTPSVRFQLVTDLAPGREFDAVEITVRPENETRSVLAEAERSWGRGVRVATLDGLPAGTHDVDVTLRLGGALVTSQSRRFVTASGSSTVTILVTRDCLGVTCSTDEACAAAQCVSVECTAENPEACPLAARCTTGTCGDPMGCVVPECRAEGFCFSAPDDSLCLGSEYCDATLGCVALGTPHDGGTDAEPIDAGPPTSTGELVFPWNGAITSVTPTIRWNDVALATEHQLAVDDSCDPFDFASCTFPSAEVDRRVAAREEVLAPLAVSATPPVGRRYFVRVRACNPSGCGPWSAVRYFDAGRARGDVNGDGFSDAIIGAPEAAGEGAAYVLFGGDAAATGLSAPAPLFSSAFSPDDNDGFGSAVAFVGDVDGDGCADFAVGAPSGNTPTTADVGMLHLYLGSVTAGPSLAVFSHTQISPGIAAARFAHAIAGVGDVDRDGRADVAIGAPNETGGGAAYLLFGRDLATGTMTRIPAPSASDVGFGSTIAGVGVRERSDYPAFFVATDGSPGIVHRFGVVFSTFSTTPVATLSSPREEPLDGFGGAIVATCDLDLDGLTDTVVGSSSYRGVGGAVIYFGHGDVVWVEPPSPVATDFGRALACADLTSDGIDDLVVTSVAAELVYLYAGGTRMVPAPLVGGDDTAVRVGVAVAAGFDFDRDGNADALVGAPGLGAMGQVLVMRGPWLAGSLGPAVSSGSGTADGFGSAIAVAPP